jgi:hypothetical protein
VSILNSNAVWVRGGCTACSLPVDDGTNVFIALKWRYIRHERVKITFEILTGKCCCDKFGRSHAKLRGRVEFSPRYEVLTEI